MLGFASGQAIDLSVSVLCDAVIYNLSVDARDFDGGLAWLNGVTDVPLTAAELIRSALTLGYPKPGVPVAPPGATNWWVPVFRMALIRGYLDHLAPNRLKRSAQYDEADRSEKASLSYYLGLFAAKLLAERLLNARYVWHYEAYRAYLGIPGRLSTRPDLLAETTAGSLIVIEAKGRTHGYDGGLVSSAKAQATAVTGLGGTPILANVAAIAWMSDNGWAVRFDDPPSSPLHLSGDGLSELTSTYLGDLKRRVAQLRALEGTTTVSLGGEAYDAFYEPEVDVHIAVSDRDPRAASLFDAGSELPNLEPSTVADEAGHKWAAGPDGVAVRLGESWAPEVPPQ